MRNISSHCQYVLLNFTRSIVNGLRDDDVESYFGGDRASFASEYSRDEGVKVFFKEHGRKGSKGSNNSLLSRKKPQAVPRPETKVRVCHFRS